MYDKENVFAKIARGEIPCNPIVENKYAISFYDINPMFKSHALVIPRGEYENILDFISRATPAEQEGFWQCFKETAARLGIKGNFNVMANAGADAPFFAQTVFHFHMHLMAGPRQAEFNKIVGAMCR